MCRFVSGVLCFTIGSLMFASCSGEEIGGYEPEQIPEIVNVSFGVDAKSTNARIWYEQDVADKFNAKWHDGDEVAIIATNGSKDKKAKFKARLDDKENKTLIEGRRQKWEHERDFYAVFPYKSNYYNHTNGEFTHDVRDQVINPSTSYESGNSMGNSFLIAKAKEKVTVIPNWNILPDQADLSVKYMKFKQVMSFLRFSLEGLEKEKIERITLRAKEGVFFTQAKISIKEGGEVDCSTLYGSNSVTARVDDHGTTAMINFAVFPTTVRNAVLEVQTLVGDVPFLYTKELPSELTFESNHFNFYRDALKLNEASGFVVVDNVFNLSEFDDEDFSTTFDEWIVLTNADLKEGDLDNLKLRLDNCESRKITLRFPNLKIITGSQALASTKNLEKVEMPFCEEIGDQTFQHCPDLNYVYMPALKKAGDWTFDDNVKNLPVVEFIAATNPGIRLQYGIDGDASGPFDSQSKIDRVKLYTGNITNYSGSLFGEQFGEDENGKYIMMNKGELGLVKTKQYFGEIHFEGEKK